MAKQFLSGNEAFAYGVRLARPQVISAYPITPQTIVVEKLSEFVEDGSLNAEGVHSDLLSGLALYGGVLALRGRR